MKNNKTFNKWYNDMKEKIELDRGKPLSNKESKELHYIMQQRYDSLPKSNKRSKYIR